MWTVIAKQSKDKKLEKFARVKPIQPSNPRWTLVGHPPKGDKNRENSLSRTPTSRQFKVRNYGKPPIDSCKHAIPG